MALAIIGPSEAAPEMVKPPGPKGHLLVGVLPEFRNDPAGFLEKMARQYGDVVYIPLGRQHIYCISHPDAIRGVLVTDQNKFKKSRMLERARVLLGDGLLTSEGDHHRRQRRLVQPAFHRDRLAGYGAVMVERAALVRDQWKPGQSFDVLQEMMRLTLAIVAKTLFSTEVDSEADEIGVALTEVFSLFEIILLPFSEILEKLPLPGRPAFQARAPAARRNHLPPDRRAPGESARYRRPVIHAAAGKR